MFRDFYRRYWPQLSVMMWGLISISPLVRWQMTCSDDGLFHIHKAVGLQAALDLGHPLARWIPQMAQGYGYPLFNYYAPLGSWLLVALRKLGLIYPLGLHLLFALTIIVAGLAVLALVRDWWGPWAGLTAAIAYMTAPYLAFDILFRAALAESLALVWPPVILWALHRALTRRDWRWHVATAFSLAALVYTHNTTALVTVPLIGAYGLLLVWEQRDWHLLWHGALSGLAGLGLSARFWVPALFERNLVQPERLLGPPIFTYYTNYISLAELLAPPQVIDPLLLNPSPAKGIGLVLSVLALFGLATTWRTSSERLRLAFFAGVLLATSVLMLAVSQPVWDAIPLLQFVQFPWRLAGLGMLAAAILAGAAVHGVSRQPAIPTALIAVVAVVGHLSWWAPTYCSPFTDVDLANLLRYEQATFTLGTSAKAEFLPAGVPDIPDDRSMASDLIIGAPPNWLRGLPEGVVLIERDDPLDFQATVTLDAPATATFHQLYFPGWRAERNGKPFPITVSAAGGLIQLRLPEGTSEIRLRFGTTPLRALAEAVSLLTIVAGTAASVLLWRRDRLRPAQTPASTPTDAAPAPVWLTVGLPLLLLVLKVGVIDRTVNPLRHPQTYPDEITLPGGVIVVDMQAPANAPSGGDFDAVLMATSRTPVSAEFRPKFTVESADGRVWNSPDTALPPRWHREPPPTWEWPPGHFAQWARRETLLPGTPPGDYQLFATIFDLDTLAPDARIPMGTLTVTRTDSPASPADLPIQYVSGAEIAPGLTLLGYNLDREEARPGDPMLITLFWQATARPGTDTLTLGLTGSQWTQAIEPVPGYPTRQWQAGDVWVGQQRLRVPAILDSGDYTWLLNGTPLGPLHVDAPDRSFERPASLPEVGFAFDRGIMLSHAAAPDTARPGEAITIDLVWQTASALDVELRSFVHIVNADGQIVAQHDGQPANGARPSAGWAPGEYIADPHTVTLPPDLPAGTYRVLAGLADIQTEVLLPATGTPDGRAVIGTLSVEP